MSSSEAHCNPQLLILVWSIRLPTQEAILTYFASRPANPGLAPCVHAVAQTAQGGGAGRGPCAFVEREFV